MLDYAYIEQAAHEARTYANVLTFPIDPILIAEKYGLKVLIYELPTDTSGAIFYKEKTILIDKNDGIKRQIFSVAHELGHFILHKDENKHFSKRDFASSLGLDTKEREANAFAASLLMPEDEVSRLVDLGLKLDDLAGYFDVSSLAMQYRLINLGLEVYV